jgi:drug/metabolite transporter (DMT)-like permease
VTPIELLVLSAALQAGSTVIQKQRVATRVPNVSLAEVTGNLGAFFGPLFRDPWWLGGLLLGVAGALTGLQALSAMDLSVIKPLGRVETLFTIFAGVLFLGERIRASEAIGVALVLGGSFALALGAGGTSGVASRESHFVLVACVGAAFALAALARRRHPDALRPELALAAGAGTLFAMGDILSKGATEVAKSGAADGGFRVLDAASMGALVVAPEFALAIAAYIAGSILVQTAFSVGRVSVIAPVLSIGSLVLPIAFGLAVLHEDVTGARLAGIAAVLLGTLLVGRGPIARDGRDQPAAARSNRSASATSSATIAAAGCTGVTCGIQDVPVPGAEASVLGEYLPTGE